MPAWWKKLTKAQQDEITTLVGSFYDESWNNPTKSPWLVNNLKIFLNLRFVTLDDVPKFWAAFLVTHGDDSIFCIPPTTPPVVDSASDTNPQSFPDQHNGFTLKPRKLIEKYIANPGDSKVQGQLFVHMTNFVCREHFVANKHFPVHWM